MVPCFFLLSIVGEVYLLNTCLKFVLKKVI